MRPELLPSLCPATITKMWHTWRCAVCLQKSRNLQYLLLIQIQNRVNGDILTLKMPACTFVCLIYICVDDNNTKGTTILLLFLTKTCTKDTKTITFWYFWYTILFTTFFISTWAFISPSVNNSICASIIWSRSIWFVATLFSVIFNNLISITITNFWFCLLGWRIWLFPYKNGLCYKWHSVHSVNNL